MQTEIRAQVWAKTNGHCWYCGKLMNPWDDFTVDHMDPQKHGGGDELGNLVPACQSCNSRKNAKNVEEYRVYLASKAVVRFWGEHALASNALTAVEPEEETFPLSAPELANHIGSCLRIGRRYSPGFTFTLIILLLQSLNNYQDDGTGDYQGHWFFHVDELAAHTKQSVDDIFSHLMTLHSKQLINISWGTGPQGGHSYNFEFSFLLQESEDIRKEDREQGDNTYLS